MFPIFLTWVFLCSADFVSTRTFNISFPLEASPVAKENVIEDNFVGISWELSSFDTLWGKSVEQQPNAMQNYLHNLVARLHNPLRIRVGGNGMDGSTYVPSQKTVLEFTDPNAYFNDVPVNFGPAFFDILNGMYDKVGPMEFTIGLSMRHPNNLGNVIELALAAEGKLGSRLDAMLLGNEPDLYADHGERGAYEIKDYVPEVTNAMKQLGEAGALNRTIIGGPTVCCQWDINDILNAGLDKLEYKYYSIQRYPNHACSGENAENTNLTYYLTHANVGGYLAWQKQGMDVAKQREIPVLMTEYNTVACGGSRISSTFGATLWIIDAALKAATMNYSAVYVHTREYGVQYNLFDPPSPETSMAAGWRTGSPYYATLLLAEVADPSGSVVVDLNLANSTTSQSATIAGYGIYDSSGSARRRLVFFNFASPNADTKDVSQKFQLPANITDQVSYRTLTAPTVVDMTNIRWAGQMVGPNGDLEGDQETVTLECEHGCSIDVPGPGVVLVVLGSDAAGSFYKGNSTIAPYHYLSGDCSALIIPVQLVIALVAVAISLLL